MLAVFALTLPIYLMIALGFSVAKLGYVAVSDMRAIGRVVLRVAMPALIFLALARAPLTETLRWDFIAGYAAGSLLVFAAGFALARGRLRRPMPQAALEALGMSCSNSAYLGMPVAALLVGDVALRAFAMAMLVENILIMPLAVTLAEASGGGGRLAALRRTLAGMVQNPLLIAVLVGVAASVTGLVLPDAVLKVLGMLAPVAAPVALLVIGSAVADLPPSGIGGAGGVWQAGVAPGGGACRALSARPLATRAPHLGRAYRLGADALDLCALWPALGQRGNGRHRAHRRHGGFLLYRLRATGAHGLGRFIEIMLEIGPNLCIRSGEKSDKCNQSTTTPRPDRPPIPPATPRQPECRGLTRNGTPWPLTAAPPLTSWQPIFPSPGMAGRGFLRPAPRLHRKHRPASAPHPPCCADICGEPSRRARHQALGRHGRWRGCALRFPADARRSVALR
jgi:hypothetical protein